MIDDLSDAELIERCLALHPKPAPAFDELYRRHAGALLMFLYGLHKHDEHASRDALQETFLRVWSALPSFRRARPFRPWLLRIARNVSLDMWKSARAKAELTRDDLGHLAGDECAPGDLAARRETAGLLREAVLALPDDQRAVFLLKHDADLTYAQVADVVGCSLRTAKYRMQAALAELGRAAERLGVKA